MTIMIVIMMIMMVAVIDNNYNTNTTNNVYTFSLSGCDVVSSAPYCDPDPEENIRIVFQLAREFDCPVDLHLGV